MTKRRSATGRQLIGHAPPAAGREHRTAASRARLCPCRRAKVGVLDNLSLGNVANLAWRKTGADLEFVQGDINDEKRVRHLVAGCDWVFHEAALPAVPLSVAKPLESNRATLEGALLMLVAMLEGGAFRLVISGIDMPGMDGYELCLAIKTHLRLRTVPVSCSPRSRRPRTSCWA